VDDRIQFGIFVSGSLRRSRNPISKNCKDTVENSTREKIKLSEKGSRYHTIPFVSPLKSDLKTDVRKKGPSRCHIFADVVVGRQYVNT
jgi:hypothetical protein